MSELLSAACGSGTTKSAPSLSNQRLRPPSSLNTKRKPPGALDISSSTYANSPPRPPEVTVMGV